MATDIPNPTGEHPPTQAPAPLPALFFRRLIAALFLKRETYDAIASDSIATRQAIAVVCLSALAQPSVLVDELGAWALPIMMVFGLVRWCVFSAIVYGIGRLFTYTPINFRRLLRCLGFAEAPGIFNFVVHSVSPPLLTYLGFFVWFWLLAAVVVAVRAAFSTQMWRALLIGVLSFVFYLLPGLLFG